MQLYFLGRMFRFSLIVIAILIAAGIILFPYIENIAILMAALFFVYFAFMLVLYYMIEIYIKPMTKITKTVDQLLEGNYHARTQGVIKGKVGELSDKINQLARHLSEITLQEQIQSEQLSTVIENSESGLVLIDEKGYIHLVNRKFASMFGKEVKDYIGYLYYDVIDNEQMQTTVQETFLSGQRVKDVVTMDGDGPKKYYEIIAAPIFNELNMLKGIVLVIYDITELKQVETMRKDFVANVSHELKTPVTSIRGFAETLLDGAHEDVETRKHFLEIIFKESKRIQHLIEDLLILSKMEKDEPQMVITEVHLDHLLEEMMPMFKQRAEEKHIQLEVRNDKVVFEADEDKVKQILLNLFTNAVNYTPENGKVAITLKQVDEFALIEVKDTGIGIEKEALPRIFERFYRVDKDRSRMTGGTGLGLAIVKHIVEAHQGKIEVASEVNKGSTFSVYLPLKHPSGT
ncbi:MAG: PAS domain-containing protein [Bacilli bacterium]|nr:PAS domain-containing protein [Bacilli bacterium]